MGGILLALLLLPILFGVIVGIIANNTEKKKEEERKRADAKHEAAVKREVENLINKGMVKTVSDEMKKTLQDYIKKNITSHINNYGYRPASITAIKPSQPIEINRTYVRIAHETIYYQKLGYYDLKDYIQVEAMGRALVESYPGRWLKGRYNYNTLKINDPYWDAFVRIQIDAICSTKGIRSLK